MTNNLAVFFGYKRDHAIADSSQFFYEVSLSRLTEGSRNNLVNSFPVLWAFIADVNHYQI